MTPQRVPVSACWTIIIPVKDTSVAKTRLRHLDGAGRAALALAFALDAAAAALACAEVRRVVAVTNDEAAASALVAEGVDIVADEPAAGLNPALEHAFLHSRSLDPASPVAAMSADLPALRADDLSRTFSAADGTPYWFVADADGLGTTMLAADSGVSLSPAFGAQSRAAHRLRGAVEIEAHDIARVRRDVDTEADLHAALRLGVGRHTLAALADLERAYGAGT